MEVIFIYIFPLLVAVMFDHAFGDPRWMPHLIIGFGKIIAFGEHKLNQGNYRKMKGLFLVIFLITVIFFLSYFLMIWLNKVSSLLMIMIEILLIFYCLAGTTLIREVQKVFSAVDNSVDEGRKQLSYIVGRDTSALNKQQIRTASLETLSENLSDGVIAPLFWYMLLGIPGIVTYKLINTLDSMMGYKNDRYINFGWAAARLDDVVNCVPARLTALIMIIVSGKFSVFSFVLRNGKKHASPNSGYPEAALAGILNCRFGGPNVYFGKIVDKPFIGYNDRNITNDDLNKAIKINKRSESCMLLFVIAYIFAVYYLL